MNISVLPEAVQRATGVIDGLPPTIQYLSEKASIFTRYTGFSLVRPLIIAKQFRFFVEEGVAHQGD